MVDETFDRDYREGRAELNAGISRALGRMSRAFGNAFKVLNRIEYNAPWASRNSVSRV